ncbi:beige/BEACH domain-containing protein [Niveomyces insectorum RCEF 264]|uniref:Beige/BEACH domain-containing protein n=1 Tax=Niveomyces insectorum RCEF 264 TaxID=1081102 RepID=A0A167UIW5_9HYPO|nr:beige/BEACH domain-containing protein [Niveomyces insectorum RCEF 264]
MATRPSRYRSSTSASNPPPTSKAAEVLQALLQNTLTVVSKPLSPPSPPPQQQQQQQQQEQEDERLAGSRKTGARGGYPDIQALLNYARQIHQYLTALPPPSAAQDNFRHMHGFQVLLSVLRAFAGFYNPRVRSMSEQRALFELLHATLAVLSAAFRGHHGNRRYFRQRVDGGGWEALEQVVASIGLGVSDSDLWSNCQLFGKLLSFALDDQRLDELCQWVATTEAPAAAPTTAMAAQQSDVEGDRMKDAGKQGLNSDTNHNNGDDDESGDDKDWETSMGSEEQATPGTQKPQTEQENGRPHEDEGNVASRGSGKTPAVDRIQTGGFDASQMQNKLQAIIGPKALLQNAEIMRAVIGFWESMPRTHGDATNPVSLLVLDTVSAILRVSFFNLSALHGTGILSRFLRLYFGDGSPITADERRRILPICRSMMYLGVNRLSDAQFLLSTTHEAASQFCLEMASKYTEPPFVQFDLSHCGYSSIELPHLGRSFPPSSGNGFTFTCWLRVDAFDPKSHTTIFGVFDVTQTCFLLLYLERGTRNFILQTSVTSPRPSVRFRSVTFRASQWYHLALVHRRGKNRASLFVNGEFVEQVKAAYPLPPPPEPSGSTDSFVSFATAGRSKPTPVQAFLGTPKDLSVQVGPGLVFSKWSLASAHLFEDTLSDDFVAVHYRLGPRYQANYQDSLGGFQTYTASARLALRNDFNGGKDESSDILRAIRDKASSIVPEHKILMSTLPRCSFRTDSTFLESLLFRSLSRASAANLLSLTAKSGTAVAINGALPCINDALIRSHGVSILTGDPVLATPFNFDDNLWRLAGFTSLALKLIERTVTADDLVRAAELVFLCINSSWRNSDAMERENGYAILGMLLRAKLGLGLLSPSPLLATNTATSENADWKAVPVTGDRQSASLRLLKLVLSFVGYDHANPLESLIINPLAYRILLIDFDTWRKASFDTQRLYYEQFNTFAVMSKFHQFNTRRLLRMRIVKRLLDAMKVETLSEDILPYFLTSFESLIRCNYNVEVHRALALFITYTLHSPVTASLPRTPRPLAATNRSSTSGIGLSQHNTITASLSSGSSSKSTAPVTAEAAKFLTRKQLGTKFLKLYERLLCEKGSATSIRKFARTVTNKWLLYLLSSEDPEVLASGSKILARLLVTQGASYTSKFGSKTGGYWIMAQRLKHWWRLPTVWLCVLAILFGKDVAGFEIQSPSLSYDLLVTTFGTTAKVVYADALVAVVAMLQQGLSDASKADDKDNNPSPMADATIPKPSAAASVPSPSGTLPNAADDANARDLVDDNNVATLEAVVRFLATLHAHSAEFRDFALLTDYVRLLSFALFPSVVSMEPFSPETELNSKDVPPRFSGGDVVVRQRAPSSAMVRTPSISSNLSASVHSNLGGSTVNVTADSAILASTDSLPSASSRPGPSTTTRHRRSSSFILLTTQAAPPTWHAARLAAHASPKRQLVVVSPQANKPIQDGLLRLIIDVFVDQIFVRKEFPGFGLALRIPPSFQEHQTYFESFILRNALVRVQEVVERDLRILCEPKTLTNIARFSAHMVESIFEGTFVNGVDVLMDFTGLLLEYLHQPDVASLKSVRLCSQAVTTIRTSFLKLVLFRLSDVDAETESSKGNGGAYDQPTPDVHALPVLERIFYWQNIVVDCLSMDASADEYYMKLVFYQLYARLLDPDEAVRLAAASIWRVLLVQKPNESATVLRQCATADQLHLARSFRRLTEVDDGTFLEWVDQHRPSLDAFFLGGMARFWDEFVTAENQRAADAAKARFLRRRDRLKQWHMETLERSNILLRHEMANSAWMKSIYATEHFKLRRLLQDQQDDLTYLATTFGKMERDLRRPGAVFATSNNPAKWKLDRTEGRNRMRLRLLPDYSNRMKDAFQSRKKAMDLAAAATARAVPASTTSSPNKAAGVMVPSPVVTASALSATSSAVPTASTAPSVATLKSQDTMTALSSAAAAAASVITSAVYPSANPISDDLPNNDHGAKGAVSNENERASSPAPGAEAGVAPEDDFELIDDPNEPDEENGFEDKNRKVMRRLEQGDVVQEVYNVSRIIGLDACEGILIVGKNALYLVDNVFQCRDGEIVNAWQAPADERDPFSQIITTKPLNGHDKLFAANGSNGSTSTSNGQMPPQSANGIEQESRSWRWHDVISVSKRRFLFRDVAIELFFRDGRSYLLTGIDNAKRDEIFGRLIAKIPHATGPASTLPNAEDAWRLEGLRVVDEGPQTLGSKFGSIFNASPWNPSMRRWQKGEISNFHYLMLINTMAGRTFNDLTQYPVFPWVLADYTSEELDLDDPATFRDLSKPMGAQTAQRQADFTMRYNTLSEMGQPPFHYGTHYSSAMVVSSYLIRLPPFVQSFLLLQGGHFDHPDRLFYSIEGAWKSASRDNGTDVRELIPEFFCLPEFLVNVNGYDFGCRQDGNTIDNVVLPPWAKGDPTIFIAKHREALESPHVSQHLHKWIDLVFGNKQRGDAAVESLNVFHHLSYHGAIDLDNIEDPQERAVVTGIIHNFGQTPRQVFSRPHPAREHDSCPIRRLDSAADALARQPHLILESRERVASLIYVPKLDRLLCASPFRLNLPPNYDKYLEWGYADNSIRFFYSDNRKLAGLFENLHIGQISCVAFADSKTLITAGEDCAVTVHAVVQGGPSKPVELLARSSLFGHKTPVTTIAVSGAFSTLLTVSQDGVAMLWDLNRLEFVRKLPSSRPVEYARINDVTGEIMLCCGPNVVLFTLNGERLLDQNVCDNNGGSGGAGAGAGSGGSGSGNNAGDDYVHACAFYEGAGNEWLDDRLMFTGHRRGCVNIWRKVVAPGSRGRWRLELVRRLDHVDPKSETGANVEAAITCITPMPQLVYTGDDDGRVYEWNLIQKDR